MFPSYPSRQAAQAQHHSAVSPRRAGQLRRNVECDVRRNPSRSSARGSPSEKVELKAIMLRKQAFGDNAPRVDVRAGIRR